MRWFLIILILILAFAAAFVFLFARQKQKTADPIILQPGITMKITSPAFGQNERIPVKYTCDGENINPTLFISGVPENTKSLALIMDDPDAPIGTFVHWTLWNMAPTTSQIAEGSVPEGALQGVTSFGKPGYGGPCPPFGTHRYFFKVYALGAALTLTPQNSAADLESAMEGHILDKAGLIGLYSRK